MTGRRGRAASVALLTLTLLLPVLVASPASAAPAPGPATGVVVSGDARFEVVTPTLVRLQHAAGGRFDERRTTTEPPGAGPRSTVPPAYTVDHVDGWLVLRTDRLTLRYREGSGTFTADDLSVDLDVAGTATTARPTWWRPPGTCAYGTRCEAEDGRLTGGQSVHHAHEGASGRGYTSDLGQHGSTDTWTITGVPPGRATCAAGRVRERVGPDALARAGGRRAPGGRAVGTAHRRLVDLAHDHGRRRPHGRGPGRRHPLHRRGHVRRGRRRRRGHCVRRALPDGGRDAGASRRRARPAGRLDSRPRRLPRPGRPRRRHDRAAPGRAEPPGLVAARRQLGGRADGRRLDHRPVDARPDLPGRLVLRLRPRLRDRPVRPAGPDRCGHPAPAVDVGRLVLGLRRGRRPDVRAGAAPGLRGPRRPGRRAERRHGLEGAGPLGRLGVEPPPVPRPGRVLRLGQEPAARGRAERARGAVRARPRARAGAAGLGCGAGQGRAVLLARLLRARLRERGEGPGLVRAAHPVRAARHQRLVVRLVLHELDRRRPGRDAGQLAERAVRGAAHGGGGARRGALADRRLAAGLPRLLPERPVGEHRSTVHFTGDTAPTWETLAFAARLTPDEAAIGQPWVSDDIGSFLGRHLPDDLYARWVQLGTFQPVLRLHSHHGDRLPWQYAEATGPAADFLRLREALSPYTYSAAWEATQTGQPVCRPLYLDDPESPEAYAHPDEYRYGHDLLVAPVVTAGSTASREVWFPPGRWVGWFDGKTYTGPSTQTVTSTLGQMPVFVRAGGIVTQVPGAQRVDPSPGAVTLTVASSAPDSVTSSVLHTDAGDGLGYQTGQSADTTLTYASRRSPWWWWPKASSRLTVGAASGTFPGAVAQRSYAVDVHALSRPDRVRVDGATLPATAPDATGPGWSYDDATRTLHVRTAPLATAQTHTVEQSGGEVRD